PIFVRDGNVYTSAGVTAGMDLALALVEEDHGHDAAMRIARHLVMFVRRPGGQSQFSAALDLQAAERRPIRDLQAWIAGHPVGDLSVGARGCAVGAAARGWPSRGGGWAGGCGSRRPAGSWRSPGPGWTGSPATAGS